MMNFLGKSFVLIHTFLSLLLLGWALAIFLGFNDFGWAVPAKDSLDKSIPSSYDKSLAALHEALRTRDILLAPIEPARKTLTETEEYFPKNHLAYVKDLKQLQSAADPLEVRTIKIGNVPLDTPTKPLGKPVLDETPLEGITKSLQAYQADLKKTHGDIDQTQEQIRDVVEKTKKITFELSSVYGLSDQEYKEQVANKAEREYLQPIWAQKVEEARLLNQRRQNLEATLKKLERK